MIIMMMIKMTDDERITTTLQVGRPVGRYDNIPTWRQEIRLRHTRELHSFTYYSSASSSWKDKHPSKHRYFLIKQYGIL